MLVSKDEYYRIKENRVQGRYVVNAQIIDFLNEKALRFTVESVGRSVQKRPIKSITLGEGSSKILMWSQMHGNESTTTKAVLDLLNFLDADSNDAFRILQNCTIKVLPILNPDGAEAYTRFNAAQVDLNRDAQNLSQPESRVLRAEYDKFQPDFCFNLHDQRTIYNVGNSPKPATVSFLAPSHDAQRSISRTRDKSMRLIAAMNETLQLQIPGQVGRYDDAFNSNCVGDTFQMLNTPTILFEAGHFQMDYEREQTRSYIFYSLVKALQVISIDGIGRYSQHDYFHIQENSKQFFDILIKNVPVESTAEKIDVGILYEEVLRNGKIKFVPKIERRGKLNGFFGHENYDYRNALTSDKLKMASLIGLLGI